MIVNTSSLALQYSHISWDICIIGSGFAGMTLALQLVKTNPEYKIALIDSGIQKFDSDIQELSDLANSPPNHAAMDIAVRRQVGGTSAIWGGRCLPYDEIDFLSRSHVEHSGWPIEYSDLFSYLPDACAQLFCGKPVFQVDNNPSLCEDWLDGDILATSIERWSLPVNLGKQFFNTIKQAHNIYLFTGFTCVYLIYDTFNKSVSAIKLKNLDGFSFDLSACDFIIAAGGLESTRLLMYSNQVNHYPAGNNSGFLGRFYQGHLSGKIADITFFGASEKTIYDFEKDEDLVYIRRRFTISNKLASEQNLLNFAAWLDNPEIADPNHGNAVLSAAYLALLTPVLSTYLAPAAVRFSILKNVKNKFIFAHFSNILLRFFSTLFFCLKFIYKRYFCYRKLPGFFVFSRDNRYALHYHAEQTPNFNSYVCLSDKLDALGVNKLEVFLSYTDQDIESVIKSHDVLANWLCNHHIGKLSYRSEDLPALIKQQAQDGIHQIGTTRMSTDHTNGVVDINCRVYGLSNVYICSSSVFPTSSQANPTLTIVCLALRLADFLSKRNT